MSIQIILQIFIRTRTLLVLQWIFLLFYRFLVEMGHNKFTITFIIIIFLIVWYLQQLSTKLARLEPKTAT